MHLHLSAVISTEYKHVPSCSIDLIGAYHVPFIRFGVSKLNFYLSRYIFCPKAFVGSPKGYRVLGIYRYLFYVFVEYILTKFYAMIQIYFAWKQVFLFFYLVRRVQSMLICCEQKHFFSQSIQTRARRRRIFLKALWIETLIPFWTFFRLIYIGRSSGSVSIKI